MVSTRDPRFKVSVAQTRDRHVLTGIDGQKVLDRELLVTVVGSSSVRLDWTMINLSGKPLPLRFAGEIGKAGTRPFAAGPVGEVKTRP